MTYFMRPNALGTALMILVPLLAHAHSYGRWERKVLNDPAAGFTLTDQDNRRVSLDDFRGKAVLVTFIFTHCPAACPLITAKLASIHHELKGKDLHILSITIDPAHDTPAVLKQYGQEWKGMDFRRWSFLTGTEEEVNSVLADYRIAVNKRGERGATGEILSLHMVDHGAKTYLIDPKGVTRFEYEGQDFETKTVMKDIAAVLSQDGSSKGP